MQQQKLYIKKTKNTQNVCMIEMGCFKYTMYDFLYVFYSRDSSCGVCLLAQRAFTVYYCCIRSLLTGFVGIAFFFLRLSFFISQKM